MKKNFKIGQSNELVQENKSFDLHNCYDFVRILLEEKKVFLGFEPNLDYGTGLPPILIKFDDVSYFSVTPGFDETGRVDLDEMGYKSPSDFDDEWLLSEEQAKADDHMLFRFIGGQSIRVLSSKAELMKAQIHTKICEES